MTGFVSAYIREFDRDEVIELSEAIQDKLKDYNMKVDKFYGESRHNIDYKKSRLLSIVRKVGVANTLVLMSVEHIKLLNTEDLAIFKSVIEGDYIRLVVLDLPATYKAISVPSPMLNRRVQHALTRVMLEAIQATISADAEIDINIPEYNHIGRKPNIETYKKILELVDKGLTYNEINKALRCSSSTIAKAKHWRADSE